MSPVVSSNRRFFGVYWKFWLFGPGRQKIDPQKKAPTYPFFAILTEWGEILGQFWFLVQFLEMYFSINRFNRNLKFHTLQITQRIQQHQIDSENGRFLSSLRSLHEISIRNNEKIPLWLLNFQYWMKNCQITALQWA